MTRIGSGGELPIACTLPTLADVKRQVEKWVAFARVSVRPVSRAARGTARA